MTTHFFPQLRPVLAPMGSRSSACARALARDTLAQIEQRFAQALDPALLQKPSSGPHSRRRLFPLCRTFWSWIWQILQSNTACREVVAQLQAMLILENLPPCENGSSAYCQARSKLTLRGLLDLLASSVRSCQKSTPRSSLLQGRSIKVADGTTVRLQDTPANRADFPPSSNQFANPGFPLLKVVALFCLASGAVIAHAVDSLRTCELRLLMSLRECFQPRDIIVADRAYGVYVLAAWLQGLQCDLVARLDARSRKVDFRKAKRRLGPKDGLFVWHKPKKSSPLLPPEEWAALPPELQVRLIHWRIERPGFRTRELTVMTTLLDAELFPAEEILQAFSKRWRLEMCLDDLKTTLGMEMLQCRSPGMVKRELMVFLITHNLIRWLMVQAAYSTGVDLERVSFTGTLDAFRQWSIAITQVRGRHSVGHRKRLWRKFLERIATDEVPLRPGRQEPRAVKRRSKYPHLNKPRHAYVERWSRNKRRRASRAKTRDCAN